MPKRCPSDLKLALTLVSTKPAPPSSRDSSVLILSSSQICSRNCAESSDQPVADTKARPSGWRVRTPLDARAALPSSTIRLTSAMSVPSCSSIASADTSGQVARCTDFGALGSVLRNRSCQTLSVMKGVKGARHKVAVRSASCKVASAAGSPSQKRRRERRTYQLERLSIKVESRRPAR